MGERKKGDLLILCHRTFAFEDLDQDDRLVICGSGKDLRLACGNGGASRNQLGPEEAGVRIGCRGGTTNFITYMTPPVVSIPRVNGFTSMRMISVVPSAPERTPP